MIKFIYSEKAIKFCEIFPLLLTVCTVVKSKGKILQNFVAFSEYMNFNIGETMLYHCGLQSKKLGQSIKEMPIAMKPKKCMHSIIYQLQRLYTQSFCTSLKKMEIKVILEPTKLSCGAIDDRLL